MIICGRWMRLAGRISATAAICLLWITVLPGRATLAQQGPIIRDSNVGYIDTAIPGDVLRLRYDAAYNNEQPSRAEFFWARSGPGGPGPSQSETGVDYQDVSAYCELLVAPSVSAFVEAPFRWLNPETNDNEEGFGDMNAGLKYAFIDGPDLVTAFQLRTYIPTGNASEGVGTDHVSLEPALLLYRPLVDRWCFEGELRYWVPIDGTEFAGDVIRYGAGVHCNLPFDDCRSLSPVFEVVGWTALDGQTSFAQAPGQFVIEDARGDTIINAKLGLRMKFSDSSDIYAGYGQPLTGAQWYENTFRIEGRWFFP